MLHFKSWLVFLPSPLPQSEGSHILLPASHVSLPQASTETLCSLLEIPTQFPGRRKIDSQGPSRRKHRAQSGNREQQHRLCDSHLDPRLHDTMFSHYVQYPHSSALTKHILATEPPRVLSPCPPSLYRAPPPTSHMVTLCALTHTKPP